jgi:hypothetical protein
VDRIGSKAEENTKREVQARHQRLLPSIDTSSGLQPDRYKTLDPKTNKRKPQRLCQNTLRYSLKTTLMDDSANNSPSLTEQLRHFSGGDRAMAEAVMREHKAAPLSPAELIHEVWLWQHGFRVLRLGERQFRLGGKGGNFRRHSNLPLSTSPKAERAASSEPNPSAS